MFQIGIYEMKILFYMKITLVFILVSVHCQTIKDKGHDNDESKSDVVKLAEEILTYIEGAILSIYCTESNLLDLLEGLLKFFLNLIFTLPDQLIRQPTNIVNQILYAYSWTLDGLVYIFVDVFLHSCIEDGLYLVLSIVLKVINIFVTLVIQLLLTLSLEIILVFKKYVIIPYLNLSSLIYRAMILPSFEPLFWTLSYLTIILLALYVILRMEKEKRKLKNVVNEYGIKVIFIFFFIVILVCYSWVPFCSVLLKVCYTVLAPFYYLGTTCLLCRYLNFFVSKCWYKLNIIYERHECIICLNKRPLVTLLPCKHSTICLECYNQLLRNEYRCPLCRATISRYKEQLLPKFINKLKVKLSNQ